MCGRFSLSATPEEVRDTFYLTETPSLSPRYNIAPTQPIAAIRTNESGKERELVMLRWGLIPNWAKDPALGSRMINARGETVAEKPSFRGAFRSRRCLIIANGYYEWKKEEGGKQPYFIRLKEKGPFALAGLHEQWKDPESPEGNIPEGPEGNIIDTCAIITTQSNSLLGSIHDRMPVILSPSDSKKWLETDPEKKDDLLGLLKTYPSEGMIYYPVSKKVNHPGHDVPDCIQPLA